MVSDRQVRRLMSLLQSEESLQIAAGKVGMDRETAAKYRDSNQLPSALGPSMSGGPGLIHLRRFGHGWPSSCR